MPSWHVTCLLGWHGQEEEMYLKRANQFDEQDRKLIAEFTAFMQRVVRNAKIDYLRQNAYVKFEIPMDKISEEIEREKVVEDNYFFEKNRFDFEEERVARAFEDLSLMRQQILKLLFIDGLSATEIAVRLNCSVKFVQNQKARALKRLRDILMPGGDENE